MPKDFNYRGKTVEELQAMSMDEFIRLLPSRMRRSLRRGLSTEQRIVLEKLRRNKGKPVRTHARDLVIVPDMLGKTIHCHSTPWTPRYRSIA
jgi:small subunit ribosomal protein S19